MLSARTCRFHAHTISMIYLPASILLRVVQGKERYSPVVRAAALRCLVGSAPLSVTRGAPYAARRRAVRRHYGV